MKIISVVGARPQFIKLAPLSQKLRMLYNEIIIHTGQHYDENMSKVFFDDLEISRPDYNLNIGSDSHAKQTGAMLTGLEKIFEHEKPDLVIVFGDTNSTLAGSLTAAKMNIPSIHIEAGLRSYNREMPEEINRIVSDHCSDFLFAPTQTAINNLQREGLSEKSYLTGDIMVDALQSNITKAHNNSNILKSLKIEKNNYYLLTLHRPYNVDKPEILDLILSKLGEINNLIIFPVHPRTKKIITTNKLKFSNNIRFIEPVGYLDFLALEYNSLKIITDSGGVQKEAYILKKPCITIRPETEWVETVADGWNILVTPGNNGFENIVEQFSPNGSQLNVFGSNVAQNMISIIQTLI